MANGTVTVRTYESFCSLLCPDGACRLAADGCELLVLSKGGSVFLPAGMRAELTGNPQNPAKLLHSYI